MLLTVLGIISAVSIPSSYSGECESGCGHSHGPKTVTARPVPALPPGVSLEMIEDRWIGGREVTAIPVTAIIYDQGRSFVMARNEETGAFERWEVELGVSDGHFIEAITGMFPGDRVATRIPNLPRRQKSVSGRGNHNFTPPNKSNPYRSLRFQPERRIHAKQNNRMESSRFTSFIEGSGSSFSRCDCGLPAR